MVGALRIAIICMMYEVDAKPWTKLLVSGWLRLEAALSFANVAIAHAASTMLQ
jgi:hypothetical protein